MTTKLTQHTPGPWRADWVRPDKARGHTFDPTCSITAYSDEFKRRVAVARIPDPISPEEAANARLIASAPEMLVLLRVCADTLLEIAESAGNIAYWNEGGQGYRAHLKTRNLLAKIEGQPQ